MRRKDKEITDFRQIDRIIRQAKICHMALSDRGRPYVVPLCFGYRDRTLFIHGAAAGRKLTVLQENNTVCVAFEIDIAINEHGQACDWGVKYRSVIATGRAEIVSDKEQKHSALDVIMEHYANRQFSYPPDRLERTVIIKVELEKMTCKVSGY